MSNITENIAFVSNYYQKAGGAKKLETPIVSNSDLLLNQLDSILNRQLKTEKFNISENQKDQALKRELKSTEIKQKQKDIESQTNYLIDQRLNNILKSLNKKDNELKVKNGIGYSPDQFDEDFYNLTAEYSQGIPTDKQLDFKNSLNKIYNSKKNVIDNNYVTLLRENQKQVANEDFSNLTSIKDINSSEDLRKIINNKKSQYEGVFSPVKGENNTKIESDIINNYINQKINTDNTLEENKKQYNILNNYINEKNGSIIPGVINSKLQEVLDKSFSNIIKNAKNNYLDNSKLNRIQLENNLDNLEITENPNKTLQVISNSLKNEITSIKDNNYLSTLEKAEEIKKYENMINKTNTYNKIYSNDIVDTGLKYDTFSSEEKRIYDKRLNLNLTKEYKNGNFQKVSDTVSKLGKLPKEFENSFITNGLNSDNEEDIYKTINEIDYFNNFNKGFINTLKEENKIKYINYSTLNKIGKKIKPFDIETLNKIKINKEIETPFTKNEIDYEKSLLNDTEENLTNLLTYDEYFNQKDNYNINLKLYDKETADEILRNYIINTRTFEDGMLIKNNKKNSTDIKSLMDEIIYKKRLYVKEDDDGKVKIIDLPEIYKNIEWELKGNDLLAYGSNTLTDGNNKEIKIVNRSNPLKLFSIENLSGELAKFYDRKKKKIKEDKEYSNLINDYYF